MQEKFEQAEAAELATRVLITPAANQQDELDIQQTPPLSARAYVPLLPVEPEVIRRAAKMRDDENAVVTPIGGQVSLGFKNQFGEQIMDDIAPIPLFGTLLYPGQIPLMVDEKPPVEHDLMKEHDFGRLPTYSDLVDSVQGQKKPVEQVLAIAARDFIDMMTMVPQEEVRPNELNEAVYWALNFIRRGWCETDSRYIQLLPYIVFYKKIGKRYRIFVYQRGKGVGEERLAMNCSVGVGGHINPLDFLSMQSKLDLHKVPGSEFGGELLNVFSGRMLCEGFWTGIMNNVIREGREEIEMRVYSRLENSESGLASKYEKKDIVDLIAQGAQNAMCSPEQWLHQRTTFFLDYASGDVEKHHLAMMMAIEVPENYEIVTNEEELVDVGFKWLEDLQDDSLLPTPLECWSRSVIDSLIGTLETIAQNPHRPAIGSRFVMDSMANGGSHPSDPEFIAKIPAADRWKIGTISQIFDPSLKFYAMNAFLRA
ncbi:hypothetical protein [Ralstonia phage RSL2]|uniref:Uncharacterized protein n=1 Tax=Ralstonia phage RSL2 TaxID=1585840 RepID=A0A0A8JBA7_9CAUD|nr:hypothetical protein [Ralstonia phage RSL2]